MSDIVTRTEFNSLRVFLNGLGEDAPVCVENHPEHIHIIIKDTMFSSVALRNLIEEYPKTFIHSSGKLCVSK